MGAYACRQQQQAYKKGPFHKNKIGISVLGAALGGSEISQIESSFGLVAPDGAELGLVLAYIVRECSEQPFDVLRSHDYAVADLGGRYSE